LYRRLSMVMFPVMTIVFIGAILWGYQENQDKNSVLIKAENQYQRAFHDLTFHMDNLHSELGKVLAVSSTSDGFQRKSLVNAWRLTSEAQSELNQLPLTLMPFNKTEEFLANMSKFSYQTAVRDLAKNPLTDKETKTLHALYDRSKELAKELRGVQAKVLTKNLRWMDVEVALAGEETKLDNDIIDGFKTVDKKVTEYSEVNWGPSVATIYETRNIKKLSEKTLPPEEIKKRAREVLGFKENAEIRVVEIGKETDYNVYSVEVQKAGSNDIVLMDFTKGGQLLWFMNPREVKTTNLSLEQAREKAEQFLQDHGFGEMRAVSFDQYNNVVSITMARLMDDVIIYPEKLVINVSLDNGEIDALEAKEYVFEHHERKIGKPAVTEQEARKKLNGNFKTDGHSLAVILNDFNEEVLCHQFTGRINGQNYRLYINAETGLEEKIEELKQADAEADGSI
jgi:spore germination protein